MNARPAGIRRPDVLAITALAAVVVLFGSTQGRLITGAGPVPRLDAVFAAIDSLVGSDAGADREDLHDGLSNVPARWRENFLRFAASDRASPPVGDRVVFVGSSSIEYWTDLQAQFPAYPVVRRGLGGATMADCLRHADRLILPSRPRVVVVYAGDNDLAAGTTPEQVVADYANLVRRVQRELPTTRFVFVSIKPSPARVVLTPRIRRTNALMAAYARTDRRLDFVDVFDTMLTRDDRPRPELFRADGLHMTPAGYTLWRDAIVGHLGTDSPTT